MRGARKRQQRTAANRVGDTRPGDLGLDVTVRHPAPLSTVPRRVDHRDIRRGCVHLQVGAGDGERAGPDRIDLDGDQLGNGEEQRHGDACPRIGR